MLVTSIPITTASWFRLTILPLSFAGEISAIYIGDSSEAMPTANPAKKRAVIKNVMEVAAAISRDETVNTSAAIINETLLPKRSEDLPAYTQPAMQPNANEAVVNPSWYALRLKCDFRN